MTAAPRTEATQANATETPATVPTRPLVVVSIINWNTPEQTLACLRSLRASRYKNYRVVVIDNGSRDNSIAMIRAAMPDITLLPSRENLGFAAGHALAWQQARLWQADAIWLVNSDALVEPHALTHLLDSWAEHGDALYGGVPLQRRRDDSIMLNFPAKFLVESVVPEAFHRDHDLPFDSTWENRSAQRVGALPGSTLFIPLRLAEIHGWMDSAWFIYCEEIDYCYRLRRVGVPRYLVPMSRAWHTAGGSQLGRARVADAIQYYHARNEILLAHRHGKRFTATLITLKKVARGFVILLRHPFRARCILRGAWDGFRQITGKRYAPDDYL
ncbi:glycosyltransferase family 2 protein [Pseudolysobacter antarcticus]|uniref:Glycosyltransferase family 2 protein n=1 Tax=Pseudolysobacter antarcticus TaxID=2511995 RepID=A0A411HPC5_9GAMM|nr:glycosyltransferase family 2 protein [Pseudolysobacter antarcticus]QBB72270.1 glycosyltransferase family 2 protein [Pseudolysobacter antarcticus]